MGIKVQNHLRKSFLCLLCLFVAVMGQAPNEPVVPKKDISEPAVPGQAAGGPHEMTAADVETFLDGLVPLQIKQEDIAGVTISVVKDGKLLFAKGYGYADVEKKKPVSAQETLFRPGSISKLFTWTAVMQLFEQGKLDLDRDVNEYLDYKIPDAFGKPITLKNIMTHTPGFEEQIKDLFLTDPSVKPNLGQYLKTHIPARIYPPGTVPAYSNYATAVAGYIVERISGRPFDEYVAENIIKPLNMTHSTFTQPLPPELAPFMSNGYRLASDTAGTFEVVNAFPAGSLSSSATDMAQFMMAHLADGELGNARILKPETARLMHSRLFALDDAANAMCYGFYEESRNGHRIIGHAGDTIYFHSDLHLVLDQKLGFFVSYNSAGRTGGGRLNLWHAFLDRYYPYTASVTSSATAKDDANAAAGTYTLSRRAETSFLKTASLVSQFSVSPVGDGDIEIPQLTGVNGKPKRWQGIGPMTFLERDGQDKLIFKPDQSGRMQMILPYPFFTGERVGRLQNGKLLLTVLGISLGLMLLTLILWPVSWFVRRHYDRTLELTSLERLFRILVRVVFILDLIFIAALFGLTMYGLNHLEVFSDQGNKWFRMIQLVGVLGAVGTLAVFVNAVLALISKRRGIWGKLQATIMLLACLGVLWFAFAGNLLRFSSTY